MIIHPPQHRNRSSQRSGTTTVEFALVLPIVFLLTMGLVEFSRVNMIRNTLQNAAYEGARAAIIPGGTAAEAEAKAGAIIDGIGAFGETIDVTPSTITDSTKEVTVTVTMPLASNLWIAPLYMKQTNMVRSCTLTRESGQSGY